MRNVELSNVALPKLCSPLDGRRGQKFIQYGRHLHLFQKLFSPGEAPHR